MEVIRFPEKERWADVLARPVFETSHLDSVVSEVINEVKESGDNALHKYTEKFDGVVQDQLAATEKEIETAALRVDASLREAIDIAIHNITEFHVNQFPSEVRVSVEEGVECWQKPVPISKVGLYIPGGTAPLFSTILMLAIPAKIAGCKDIVLCSPPSKDGTLHDAIMYAAWKVGVTKVFKLGGVQAIAAMAYGTESVPKVDKIFGPGNQYVTAAKQVVARDAVAIDMPAGPSEVAVIADASSNAEFVASDLLSQAEHGKDSQVILFSDSEEMISEVLKQVDIQLEQLPKKEYAQSSLSHSKAFLVKNKVIMMDMVNTYAPEHLIISTSDADTLMGEVENAGSVFVGPYTPESAGDYASGTNHTLPTHGWARSYSGVNLDSYMKKITFQRISQDGLYKIGPTIEKMAAAEELIAHKNAVTLRLRNK